MMERLTIRCEITHDIVYKNSNDPDGSYNIFDLAKAATADPDGEEGNVIYEISGKLAAYEDTGLTPEEINQIKAEPEPKRGEWIEQIYIDEPVICSECLECPDGADLGADITGTFNFCPNCGADMRTEGKPE